MRVQTRTVPYDQWDNTLTKMIDRGWALQHFNSLYKPSDQYSYGDILLMYSGVFTKED